MSLNAKNAPKGNSKNYEPIDPGAYPARLVQIIDLGMQPQEYAGEEKAPKNEMMLTYEFLDEFLPDDNGDPDESKPRWLSETIALYNLDIDKAKSTARYYALDPDVEADGEWLELIEKPCTVTVIQNKKKDKVYNNIAGISAMRAKDARNAPQLVNPPKTFSMDEPDITIFLSLPQWVQDKIKGGLEYTGSPLERLLKTSGKGDSQKKQTTAGGASEAIVEDSDDSIPFDQDDDY